MEHNDLGPALDWNNCIGVMFDELIASPAPVSRLRFERPRIWGKKRMVEQAVADEIDRWTINDLPFRSLRRIESMLVPIEVYTFFPREHADTIYDKLHQWGLRSFRVYSFSGPFELAVYLRANMNVRTIYVPTEELWHALGPRASVTASDQEIRL